MLIQIQFPSLCNHLVCEGIKTIRNLFLALIKSFDCLSLEIEYFQTTCYWKTKNPHLKMGSWRKRFHDVKMNRGVRKKEINLLITTTDILKWSDLKLNSYLHTENSQRLLHLLQRNHSTTFIMQRTIMPLHNIIKVSLRLFVFNR